MCPPGVPLGPGFSDTHDSDQSGAVCGGGFQAHCRIILAIIRTPFRMTDDNVTAATAAKHPGADIAGMGAGFVAVAILTANRNFGIRQHTRHRMQKNRRRTYQQLAWQVARPGRDVARQRRRAIQAAIHLPVSRNERPPYRIHDRLFPLI
jgi:hypothetical protein